MAVAAHQTMRPGSEGGAGETIQLGDNSQSWSKSRALVVKAPAFQRTLFPMVLEGVEGHTIGGAEVGRAMRSSEKTLAATEGESASFGLSFADGA